MVLDLVRVLATTEEVYVGFGAYGAYSVRLRGMPEMGALARAWHGLQTAYPVLATRLVSVNGGHGLAAIGPTGIHVEHGDVEAPLPHVDLDPERALAGLWVVRGDEDCCVVTLLVHHCIGDGHYSLVTFADFWARLATGSTKPLGRGGYPDAVETLFRARGIGDTDTDYRHNPASLRPRALTEPTLREPFVTTFVRRRLTREATAALNDYARTIRLTVNSLVNAAIARTEGAMSATTQVRVFSPVDLRARVDPPIESTAGTDILGWAELTLDTRTGELPQLAADLADQLRAALAAGAIHASALRTPEVFAAMLGNDSAQPVLSSNWRAMPPFAMPQGIEIEDFRLGAYNRPRYPGVLNPPEWPRLPAYFTGIVHGRLGIEIAVPATSTSDTARLKLDRIHVDLHHLLRNTE